MRMAFHDKNSTILTLDLVDYCSLNIKDKQISITRSDILAPILLYYNDSSTAAMDYLEMTQIFKDSQRIKQMQCFPKPKKGGIFNYSISEITDTIPQGAYVLRPFIGKYLRDKGVSGWDSRDQVKMELGHFIDEISKELSEYLFDLEEFDK